MRSCKRYASTCHQWLSLNKDGAPCLESQFPLTGNGEPIHVVDKVDIHQDGHCHPFGAVAPTPAHTLKTLKLDKNYFYFLSNTVEVTNHIHNFCLLEKITGSVSSSAAVRIRFGASWIRIQVLLFRNLYL
jgi:hypothetical protein